MWRGHLPRLAVGPRLSRSAGVRALKVTGEGGTSQLVVGAAKISGNLRKHWAKLHPVGGASRLVCGEFHQSHPAVRFCQTFMTCGHLKAMKIGRR